MAPPPAFRAVLLAAGLTLAACGSPASPPPAAAPTSTVIPAPTLASPTEAPAPTAPVDSPAAPTETTFSGAPAAFDRLSLVIPSEIAAGGSGTLVPEVVGEAVAPWDVAPEHVQFVLEGYPLQGKLHQPQIYVYPAQAYAQLQERGAAAQSLERLQAVLEQSAMVNIKELPMVPFFNVTPALAAQVEVIPFQNGRGVRMITQYAMARAIINNQELFYHFQGLTEDGQFYVIAILPVTAPGLPEDGQPGGAVPQDGVAVPDFNDMNADWMGYYGAVRQMLQGLEPGAYSPTLDQLDALIGSITIGTAAQ